MSGSATTGWTYPPSQYKTYHLSPTMWITCRYLLQCQGWARHRRYTPADEPTSRYPHAESIRIKTENKPELLLKGTGLPLMYQTSTLYID